MITTLAMTIILFSMFVSIPPVDATCTTTKIGKTSFTNCSDGRSGFSVQSGNTSFHQFSDGSTSMTNSFGNTSVSSSNQPGLGGTNQPVTKNMGISQWNDGVSGIHQNFGNMRMDSYSDGTTCTTSKVGTMDFTTCNGKSQDATKRSTIIGTETGATDR